MVRAVIYLQITLVYVPLLTLIFCWWPLHNVGGWTKTVQTCDNDANVMTSVWMKTVLSCKQRAVREMQWRRGLALRCIIPAGLQAPREPLSPLWVCPSNSNRSWLVSVGGRWWINEVTSVREVGEKERGRFSSAHQCTTCTCTIKMTVV